MSTIALSADRAMDMPRARPHAGALRIGVLLDAHVVEAWVIEALRGPVLAADVVVTAVAVVRSDFRRSAPAAVHAFIDTAERVLRCGNEPLLAHIDAVAALAPVDCFEVAVTVTDGAWTPDAAALASLRRCAVDVWLCCTAEPPRCPLPEIASRGVLGLEIGDRIPAANRWAGAAEIGAGSPVTTTSVVDYMDPPGSWLTRSSGATVASSSALNRLAALRRGVSSITRMLADPANGVLAGAAGGVCQPVVAPASSEPTFGAIARMRARSLHSVAINRLRALRWREQWQIAYQFSEEDSSVDRDRLRYLVPPPDRDWADPFALRHGDRDYVFFEDAPIGVGHGRIMVVEVREDGLLGEPRVALERPYHISYPFLFRHDGALFMLPETASNGRLEVYRCESFPLHWRLHAVALRNVRALDPTLWRAGDRWWLFVNVITPGMDGNDELHLYSSSSPFGPWQPHRRNPIVTDGRGARSAGPLFVRAGELYRPSQDCTPMYGRSVVVQRVNALDESTYSETPVERLDPGWREDVERVHTLGGEGRLRVLDCSVRRRRW